MIAPVLLSQPAMADDMSASSGPVYKYRKLPVDALSAFQRADERADYLSRAEKAIKEVLGQALHSIGLHSHLSPCLAQ